MSKFETKEQYNKFISTWKLATNAEEAKSKRVVCDHVQYNWNYHGFTDEEKARLVEKGYTVSKTGNRAVLKDGSNYKEHGWLDAEHFIFRNIVLSKDPKRGFTPKTAEHKMNKYESPWYGFICAAYKLERIIKDASYYLDQVGKGKVPVNQGDAVKDFLEPFNGEITIADLVKIDLEELANARKFHS